MDWGLYVRRASLMGEIVKAKIVAPLKQCTQCGTVTDLETPRCWACGSTSWQPAQAQKENMYTALGAAIVVVIVITVGWLIVRRP